MIYDGSLTGTGNFFAIRSGYSGWDNVGINYIPSNGNVGIGTTSPTKKLEVYPDTDSSAIIGRAHVGNALVGSGLSDYAAFSHIDHASLNNYALYQGNTGETLLNSASGNLIRFRIANSDKMVINSSGNVGIGTDNPQSKLDVEGNVTIGSNYSGTNSAPTNGLLVEGNVGIGVTNPSNKLEVNGDVDLNSTSSNGNKFIGYGTIPIGGIIMWNGSSVPDGWALCDGGSGTPNLSGRFILGSGKGAGLTSRSVGSTGGTEKHKLTVNQMPKHSHEVAFSVPGRVAFTNCRLFAKARSPRSVRPSGNKTVSRPQ